MGDTALKKNATLHTSASLSPLSPQPQCRAVHGPHAYAHASGTQPHVFFATPASRRTAPQMATRDELPHDHPGRAPFFWMHPDPSDMPSPLSTCCHHPTRIPHALRVSQPQPRPHACAVAPFDASRHVSTCPTPPFLDAPPPSQTRPVHPSCAANQLQFLLTSDSISFYFPSILLFQLFSSFVSCNCTPLTSQTSLRPHYEHQPRLMERDNDTSLSTTDSISTRIASTWACLMSNPTCHTRSSGTMTSVSPTRVAASLQLPPSPSELSPLFDHPISPPISGSDTSTDSHRHYQHLYSCESSSGVGSLPSAILRLTP